MKLRWSHAVLYVRDLDKMIAFYRDVLGFQVTDRGSLDPANPDGMQLVFLSQDDTEHHQLAFVPVRGDGPSTTLDHMAFKVDSLADVKAMADKLSDDDRATGLAPITHGNTWSIYFKDPEDNGVEIFCESPFHVAQPQAKPWDLSKGEADLRNYTEQEFGDEREFKPIDEFYAEHRQRLEE